MARTLTLKQERFVSAYIGPAKGNATEAARQAGYSGSDLTLGVTGYDLLRNPKILAAVANYRASIRAEGIANRQNRVDRLNDDWYRMQRLRDERAAVGTARLAWEREQAAQHPDPDRPPSDIGAGADTGLIVRQEKPSQYGTLVEYTFDRALMAELRATEEQAAKELGQWVDKTAATDPTGEHAASDPHTELLSRIAELAARARVREVHPEPAGSGSESPPQ